jgi:hypothetical protein
LSALMQLGERGDQALGGLPVGGADALQLLAGALMQLGDALGEHLCQVVAGPDLRAGQQAHQQRGPLGQGVVFEFGGVQGVGLGGEVGELPWRESPEQRGRVAEPLQPGQMLQQLGKVGQGRVPGRLLEPVVGAARCARGGSRSRSRSAIHAGVSRSVTMTNSRWLTTVRTRRASRSSVEKAGSSNRPRTSASTATLTRSAGWSSTSAASAAPRRQRGGPWHPSW